MPVLSSSTNAFDNRRRCKAVLSNKKFMLIRHDVLDLDQILSFTTLHHLLSSSKIATRVTQKRGKSIFRVTLIIFMFFFSLLLALLFLSINPHLQTLLAYFSLLLNKLVFFWLDKYMLPKKKQNE